MSKSNGTTKKETLFRSMVNVVRQKKNRTGSFAYLGDVELEITRDAESSITMIIRDSSKQHCIDGKLPKSPTSGDVVRPSLWKNANESAVSLVHLPRGRLTMDMFRFRFLNEIDYDDYSKIFTDPVPKKPSSTDGSRKTTMLPKGVLASIHNKPLESRPNGEKKRKLSQGAEDEKIVKKIRLRGKNKKRKMSLSAEDKKVVKKIKMGQQKSPKTKYVMSPSTDEKSSMKENVLCDSENAAVAPFEVEEKKEDTAALIACYSEAEEDSDDENDIYAFAESQNPFEASYHVEKNEGDLSFMRWGTKM